MDECPVCLEGLPPGPAHRCPCCSRRFHMACAARWRVSCPTCRVRWTWPGAGRYADGDTDSSDGTDGGDAPPGNWSDTDSAGGPPPGTWTDTDSDTDTASPPRGDALSRTSSASTSSWQSSAS